jgi:hypothetical protein
MTFRCLDVPTLSVHLLKVINQIWAILNKTAINIHVQVLGRKFSTPLSL